MLQGNEQMLVARFGGLWHIRYPKLSVEKGIKHLLGVQEKIRKRAESVLAEKGCDSDAGVALAKALKRFQETLPPVMMAAIDQGIVKAGGKVTSLEEVEAAGNKK